MSEHGIAENWTLADLCEDQQKTIERLQAERDQALLRLQNAIEIIEVQARDEALWFKAQYVTEAILQEALRRLHAAIEGKTAEECARETLRRAAKALEK